MSLVLIKRQQLWHTDPSISHVIASSASNTRWFLPGQSVISASSSTVNREFYNVLDVPEGADVLLIVYQGCLLIVQDITLVTGNHVLAVAQGMPFVQDTGAGLLLEPHPVVNPQSVDGDQGNPNWGANSISCTIISETRRDADGQFGNITSHGGTITSRGATFLMGDAASRTPLAFDRPAWRMVVHERNQFGTYAGAQSHHPLQEITLGGLKRIWLAIGMSFEFTAGAAPLFTMEASLDALWYQIQYPIGPGWEEMIDAAIERTRIVEQRKRPSLSNIFSRRTR